MSGIWDSESAVIGGGPGGLVSALYLKRFRRSIVLVHSGVPRAFWIPKTHNLIGFDKGISGKSLLRRLHRQIDQLKIERIEATARVERFREGFKVLTDQGTFTAKKIILATGIRDVQPDIPNVTDLRLKGLLRYCPICDAYEFRDKTLAVLAKNDHGLQEALFLAPYAKKLRILAPEGLLISVKKRNTLRRNGAHLYQGELEAIEPAAKALGGMRIHLKNRNAFSADACYVALGSEVIDDAYKGMPYLKRTEAGFLTATTEQRLSVRGLFGVGDCVNLLGQLSVAAGQAAVAATTLHNDLLEW